MAKKFSTDDVKFIANLLRQGSIKWRGRSECLARARRKVKEGYYKNGNAIFKFHWQCAKCGEWFRDEKSLEVDHIVEVGALVDDLNILARKILAEPEDLQALCVGCHLKKTTKFNNARLLYKRK